MASSRNAAVPLVPLTRPVLPGRPVLPARAALSALPVLSVLLVGDLLDHGGAQLTHQQLLAGQRGLVEVRVVVLGDVVLG